ncbi:4-(cytidine 5'-diphospho)-2-C-methyl-D-erythritol kinase, partial [Falsiroseomonas sp.]|uniref:4-(cytidine 5'-diphospho)-2-C-methyl-D-erythritol kinase n=1 Tax=Falsiroseomonas sp. TaxID=2870721 RepID=UPI002733D0FD
MVLTARLAPAKVNLFLHVGPVEADGYHPLASLVAFADVGDRVTVAPGERLSLTVAGPFGGALGAADDNLILRALRALGAAAGIGDPALAVTLDKRLPIAAGLGGGSSDAGAALKLARDALDLPFDDAALARIAGSVGADGPMCLHARAAWAGGRGDRLNFEPRLPALPCLLVNPGVPSSTGAVYRAWDAGPPAEADMPPPPLDWSPGAVAGWLQAQRNDLQTPAVALQPAIGQVLAAVEALPGARLVRMSGSGATVFALFDTREAAAEAGDALRAQ